MSRCNPYDSDAVHSLAYSNLVVGHYRMRRNYHIRRPAGTDDWLLMLTLSGAGKIRHAGNNWLLKPGNLLVFMPGIPHDYATDPETGRWEFLWVHFQPPSHWLPLLEWSVVDPGILIKNLSRTSPCAKRVTALFEELYQYSVSSHTLRDWFAMNRLEALLLHCNENARATQAAPDMRLKRLQEFIHKNLAGDLSLARLAKETHISVSHLNGLFRRQLKTTPQKYIEHYRMAMAKRLLNFANRSIKEVACDLGYKDPLYFSKRFRARNGLSPEQYRLKCTANVKARNRN